MRSIKTLLATTLAWVALAATAGPVNVNTADAKTLARELTGVGQAKAQAIVAYREANGPFTDIAQLAEVKGIGARLLEKNVDHVRFSDPD